MKINEELVKNYVDCMKSKGPDGFCKQIVAHGIRIFAEDNNSNPDEELLDISYAFLVKYRKTGQEELLQVHSILRRAAHILYRQFLKINPQKTINKKFLNLVV